MDTTKMPGHKTSKIERAITFLTKIVGDSILWCSCILLHIHLIAVICSKLGIDIQSYPDTLEYRLLFAYLLLTQYGFIIWVCPMIDKFLSFLLRPLKLLIKKIEEHYENDLKEEK